MSDKETTQAETADEIQTPEPEHSDPPEGGGEDELTKLAREKEELYDRLLRTRAELENYRKRVLREKQELRVLVRSEMIRELLPVLDAGEKGLATLGREGEAVDLGAYRDGFELLVRQLEQLLERYGVQPVPGVGFEFDPRYHEAVAREASDEHPDGHILEEFRRGYLLGDHLVRPSQVKVAVAPEVEGVDGE